MTKKIRICVCGCRQKFICNENCYSLKHYVNKCHFFKCVSRSIDRNSWVECNQHLTTEPERFMFR